MFKTPEKLIRVFCVILAAVVVAEIALLVGRSRPLSKLEVPPVPSLALSATNSGVATKSGTNSPSNATNNRATTNGNLVATNTASSTNIVAVKKTPGATNSLSSTETNQPVIGSNFIASVSSTNNGAKTNQAGTNSIAASRNGTNNISNVGKTGRSGGGVAGGPMAGGAGPRAELPAPIKARIDRIAQSGILGMIVPPPPMALLGIAGDEAFIRSPDGQTGAVKEGAKLGSLKLIQIGTNRVLIEQDGEKKELMIFAGLGGDSLMPKEKPKTNEIKKPSP